MKSFDDFLKELTPDTIGSIVDDVNQKTTSISENHKGGFASSLSNQIGITAFTISVELLGLYHHWLYSEDEKEEEEPD